MDNYYGKLILKPTENNLLDKKFKMIIPAYYWDYSKNITLQFSEKTL